MDVYMGNKSWKQSSIDFKEYTNISFVMATRQNDMMMHILVQAKRFKVNGDVECCYSNNVENTSNLCASILQSFAIVANNECARRKFV